MPIAKVIPQRIYPDVKEKEESTEIRIPSVILSIVILVAVMLVYVWSHLSYTQLKYQMAEEVAVRDALMEENRQLKVEVATLKSPRRIEPIAREKLKMIFPEKEQVVLIK
jgi:cell division protein FtsL